MLFVVDAQAGITPGDEEIAAILRASTKPVIVLANKIDDPRRDLDALEFHRLGLGDPVPLSALHGHGTGDLLDEIVARLPGPRRGDRRRRGDPRRDPRPPERRQVVAPERAARRGAGDRLRRPGDDARHDRHRARARRGRRSSSSTRPASGASARQRQGIEYYSELRALAAAERADVALVLVDARRASSSRTSRSPTSRERPAARRSSCSRSGTSRGRRSRRRGALNRRLRQRPPVVAVSAHDRARARRGCSTTSRRSSRSTRARISTPELNRALGELREARPGRRRSAGAASSSSTPRRPRCARRACASSSTTRGSSHATTAYWVENELRSRFELQGVPVVDRLRRRTARREGRACRRRLVGDGVRLAPRRARPRGRRSRAVTRRRRPRSATPAGTRATSPASTSRASRRRRSRTRRWTRRTSSSSPSRARRSGRRRALPGARADPEPDEGTRSGDGRAPLDGRRDRPVAVLSGPNIAEEIVRGLPAAAVVACADLTSPSQLQLAINSTTFRVYAGDDVVGVELCAAAKNVIALAAGGAEGLGLGDNAKAALVARGSPRWHVSARRPARAGDVRRARGDGRPDRDLLVASGRNRRCGELVARGVTPGRRRRRSAWSSRASRRHRCSAISRAGSGSSCRSPKACTRSSRRPALELVGQLMRRQPTVE